MSILCNNDFINISIPKGQIQYDNLLIGGCFVCDSSSYNLCNSSSSNTISTNAKRKYEQFNPLSRAIFEILKARGRERYGPIEGPIIVNSLTEFITCPRKMANVEVWGIAQIPHHISTGITPSCFSLDKTRKRFDNFETKTTRKSDVKMEEIEYNPGLEMGSSTESHHSHQSSPTRRITSAVVNKCKPSRNKKAQAVYKVTKTREVKESQLVTDLILSQVIRLEQELGCEPGILDLLCRFEQADLDLIWGQLIWLYPDLMDKGAVDIQALEQANQELQERVIAS
jgi:hypothetical protein